MIVRTGRSAVSHRSVTPWHHHQPLFPDDSEKRGRFTYPIGRLTRVIESAVTTVYCYDNRGNVTQKQQATASGTDTTGYAYTAANRLSGITYPSGTQVSYAFDTDGRIQSATLTPVGGGSSTVAGDISYLPFGPINSYTLGNGQVVARAYDANYAMTDLTSPALNLHFARELMGHINAEGNAVGASPATETYSYDPLYRLKGINDGSTPLEALTYNSTGDRTSKTGAGLAAGTYSYQSGTHRLTTIGNSARTYDANGDTTGSSSAGQTWGYGYNGRHRLIVVQANGGTVGTYAYNAMGERIQKVATLPTSITQRFEYDEASHLIGEYTGANERDTIWLSGMPVATVDTAGTNSTVNFVTADQLGTPRVVTNSAGTTIWQWAYTGNPFGELAPTSTYGYTLNLRYPGQYYDAESGTNYNDFRNYDPSIGGYAQPDPTGFNGGINLYAYANRNPLSYVDPLGLAGTDWKPEIVPPNPVIDAAADRLQTLANIAAENVDNTCGLRCSLPWIRGTLIHSEFKRLVDSTCPASFRTEVSYLEHQVVAYGTPGSSRADVVFGPLNAPLAVYDLKTGWAYLSWGQAKAYGENLPPLTPISIIRPDGG